MTRVNGSLWLDGNRVRQIRKYRGYTTREFAELCGVSRSAVYCIEYYKNRTHPSTLQLIAEALDVLPHYLVDFERNNDTKSTSRN